MSFLLAPFRGTALHYLVAYLDAVCLGAARDMADRQHPEIAGRRDAVAKMPFRISPAQIASLEEQGYLVMDAALTSDQVQNARNEADALQLFPTGQHGSAVRTDEVRWLRDDESPGVGPGLSVAICRLRAIAQQLHLGGFRGFQSQGFTPVSLGVPRALQLSRYPAQDAVSAPLYRPHFDGYMHKAWSPSALAHRLTYPEQSAVAARQLTAIVYLQDPLAFSTTNDEGGELVLHLKEPVRVAPRCGRLVIFDSKTGLHTCTSSIRKFLTDASFCKCPRCTGSVWMEAEILSGSVLHEVLPHTSPWPRMALTCWIGGAHAFWKRE